MNIDPTQCRCSCHINSVTHHAMPCCSRTYEHGFAEEVTEELLERLLVQSRLEE